MAALLNLCDSAYQERKAKKDNEQPPHAPTPFGSCPSAMRQCYQTKMTAKTRSAKKASPTTAARMSRGERRAACWRWSLFDGMRKGLGARTVVDRNSCTLTSSRLSGKSSESNCEALALRTAKWLSSLGPVMHLDQRKKSSPQKLCPWTTRGVELGVAPLRAGEPVPTA